VVRSEGLTIKSKLSAALAAAGCALALSVGDANASTYDVSFTAGTLATGTVSVTGSIVTDCDSCFLLPADIMSYSFTFAGASITGTFSGTSSFVTAAGSPFPSRSKLRLYRIQSNWWQRELCVIDARQPFASNFQFQHER
jgi:hypothetical protein